MLSFLLLPFFLFGNLGQHQGSFWDEERMRPIEMVVWYPTMAEAKFNEETVWQMPNVALDAPMNEGKRPLILLSHGWGGEAIELIWLAEKLVQEGYIVVGIDHYGNTWKNYSETISLETWNRPVDISQAIDHLLETSPFASSIDPERIGFAGFSMGGFTGVWLAGGEINHCSYHDPRIKAFFLMAPRTKDFSPSSLKGISSPLFIVAGESDTILPYKDHSCFLAGHVPNMSFNLLEGEVGHSVFLNSPTELGKRDLSIEIVQDPPSVNREEIHIQVSQMALQFFVETL